MRRDMGTVESSYGHVGIDFAPKWIESPYTSLLKYVLVCSLKQAHTWLTLSRNWLLGNKWDFTVTVFLRAMKRSLNVISKYANTLLCQQNIVAASGWIEEMWIFIRSYNIVILWHVYFYGPAKCLYHTQLQCKCTHTFTQYSWIFFLFPASTLASSGTVISVPCPLLCS